MCECYGVKPEPLGGGRRVMKVTLICDPLAFIGYGATELDPDSV